MATMAAGVGGSVITTFLKPMIEKASEEVADQCCVTVHINREMSNLIKVLNVIERALPEAEEKKIKYNQISTWLKDLEDICYEGRDILDEFVTVSAVAKIKSERASKRVKFNSLRSFSLVQQCFSICGSSCHAQVTMLPLRLRCRLANKIRSIRKRLEVMKKDLETAKLLTFKTWGEHVSANAVERHDRPKTGPFPDKQKDLFVGREVEKESIMDKLLDYKDNHVHVVPITGMGGVGKTTLAQSVYNDERVTEQNFPNKKWLCVGEAKFNANEIINKITNDSVANDDVETYQKKLKDKLKDGRFLIVLDDLWDIDSDEWEVFWNPLTHIEKGGIVIITTREKKVLTAIGTQVLDDLKPLGYEDSWKIFQTHAFNNGNDDDPKDKKSIAKKIVKKLHGLPLALRVVGRSLLNEHDVVTWKNFLVYHKWMESQKDNDIMSTLRWSYNLLPPRLKKCFAYCSLFPKDLVFDDKILVHMWMAHDFIDMNEKERPEDIGAEYFKQLVKASLFQFVDGKYVMHDMIHDLAMLVSKDEIVTTKVEELLTSEEIQKFRHISFHVGDNYWGNLKNCKDTKRLQTLYSYDENGHEFYPEPSMIITIINDLFQQMKSLRVLVLISKAITSIPDCISKLIHLRYLDIEDTEVQSIPDSLCDLYNLQTFLAPTVVDLPKNTVNMLNLRCLNASLSTCKGVSNLLSLQFLYSINICKDDDTSELGCLRQLRGKLRIQGLENVTGSEDAAKAMMKDKTYLEGLNLVFAEVLGTTDHGVQEEVLASLECPPNLTDLTIHGYNGRRSPNWMSSGMYFAKLKRLELDECSQLVELPPLGQLNYLEFLHLDRMDAITRLGDEFYGKWIDGKVFFPALKTLKMTSMKKLKEWKNTEVENGSSTLFFPFLTELWIHNCPELLELPPLGQLNYLEYLSLHKLDAISKLGDEFYGKAIDKNVFFPALKNLYLKNMKILKEWKFTVVEDDDNMMFFPRLTRLDIFNCPELVNILPQVAIINTSTNLSNFMGRYLSYLELNDCHGVVVLEVGLLVSLKCLSIWNCCKLKRVTSVIGTVELIPSNDLCQESDKKESVEKLFRVEKVYISFCDELVSFPSLVAIEELIVSNCKKLRSLSIGLQGWNSLQRLEVSDCLMLEAVFEEEDSSSSPTTSSSCSASSTSISYSLPPSTLQYLSTDNLVVSSKLLQHDLVSINYLKISKVGQDCFNNVSKKNWNNLKLLEILVIYSCEDLEFLPLDIYKLPSLKKLYLQNCPKLQALPDEGLPPSLKCFSVRSCPLLRERCEEESGPEWQKIKHFCEIKINFPVGCKDFDEQEVIYFF